MKPPVIAGASNEASRNRGPVSVRALGATAKEHRTVSRVTTILEAVAADPRGARLSRLSDLLDAPKSSVFSLLKGLVATGYLSEEDGAYVLGPAIHALLDFGRPELVDIARPYMSELVNEFGETVMLATPVGDSVVYVAKVETTASIRYSAPLRERRPLYPTSSGKCLLAHMSERRRQRYLEAEVPNADERARISAELARVREEGVAVNNGETLPDVSAVAAAILVGGKPLASIAIAGPTSRMTAKLEPGAVAVRRAVEAVSARL